MKLAGRPGGLPNKEAHALLHDIDGAVGDGRDALGALTENARDVGGVGGDLAVALLERFQVRDGHLRDALLEIAVAQSRELRLDLVIRARAEALVYREQIR